MLETQLTYRGTVKSCLRQLSSLLKGRPRRQKVACELLGISPKTLSTWIGSKSNPAGANLWSAMVLLDQVGFKVEEFNQMPDFHRTACKLIAFGLENPDRIAKWFGHVGKLPRESLYARFRNNVSLSKSVQLSVQQQLAPIMELITDTDAERRAQLAEVGLVVNAPVPVNHQPPATPVVAKEVLGDMELEAMIESFAYQVGALLPVARLLESERYPEEVRQKLRRRIGSHKIFEFSNLFARLCSKTAREQVRRNT